MKSANKYDKSISQKHVMINRAQRELKWLRVTETKVSTWPEVLTRVE